MAIDGELRALFRANLRRWDWAAIESGATAGGIPDSNYCFSGVEGWIEFKKTNGWVVTFQPMQVPWIMRRCRAGGRVHVAVRQVRKDGDVLHLYLGQHADRLADLGIRDTPAVGSWKAPWPWQDVGGAILWTGSPPGR
jgi:hypothetical protein